MASQKTTDFYSHKPTNLSRFVYRRLKQALLANPDARQQAVSEAISELLTGTDPDLRKFKFSLPDFLKKSLSPAEIARFRAETSVRRAHASELKMVFPHVSDEFTLDQEFLASVFDMDGGPQMKSSGGFFTVGSCFARNIARFLASQGYKAQTFELAEDLNSPISNAFIFDMMRRPPAEQLETLNHWVRLIFPELSEADTKQMIESKSQGISSLAHHLGGADCVVLTLGNVVDFFKSDTAQSTPLIEKIFPKFVAVPPSEDIAIRYGTASRLKSKGATLRLASYGETVEAILCCIKGLRTVTQAPIVITLSPVPIDSVIGLAETNLQSAIEVDCVSKSRLRSALDEILLALRHTDQAIYYFPSFEIVRWVAPMLPIPSFGFDDAAARHVSSPILDSVCSLFLKRFVKWTDKTKEQRSEAKDARPVKKVFAAHA